MGWKKWAELLGVVLVVAQPAMAREGGFPYKLMNRLRVEYDDNYDEVADDPKSSFKVIEELELAVDVNLQQTFIGINVRPSFVWWENRPGDDTDIHAYVDLLLNHHFSRRVSVSLRESFRRAEAPELIENGEAYRKESNFNFNKVDGALSMLVRPDIYLDLSAAYSLIRYDDDDLSMQNDYNKYLAGTRVRYQMLPATEISANLDYENIDYNESIASRGSSLIAGGMGVEHMFSPNLLGSAKLGYQYRDNKDSYSGEDTAPYGDVGLTILPSPQTRISLGASYSLLETDIYPYTQQQRMRGYGSVSYDLTARLTLTVSGSYTTGDYDAEDLPKDALVGDLPAKQQAEVKAANPSATDSTPLSEQYISSISDGTENLALLSTSLMYKLNRMNWLELGWKYTTMDSDLRDDFNRNIIMAGWKLKL